MVGRLSALLGFVIGAVSLLEPVPASATQADLFGPSTRSVSMAGSGTALEDGAAALTLNSGVLGLVERDFFGVGYLGARVDLSAVVGVRRLDGQTGPMPQVTAQPHVISIELVKTITPWVRAGVHVGLPLPWIYFHETKDPWVPYSMRWQNRFARGLGTAGLSVRIPVRGVPRVGGVLLDDTLQGGLWIGASVSLRPRGVINVELDITGLESEDDEPAQVSAVLNDVDLAAKYVLRPQVALLADFGMVHPSLDGLRLGLSWAPASSTDISPIRLDVEVLDLENVNAVFSLVELIRAEVFLSLTDFYDPHQVRISVAWDRPRLALTADVQINLWSQLSASYGRVLDGEDGEAGKLVIDLTFNDEPEEYSAIGGRTVDPAQFRDTVDVAVGAELRPPGWSLPNHPGQLELAVRLGGKYQMGAARAVDGPSGVLDGDTVGGAVGLGLSLPLREAAIFSGPVTVDWGLQVLRLLPVELPKTDEGLAGLQMPVAYDEGARWPGGWVIASGASVGLAF